MGKITKIESQKDTERASIYIDQQFFIGVYIDLVYTLNLKVGKEINEKDLKILMEKEMYLKAKNKALSILSKASQSENTLRYKLSRYEFDEITINQVIDFLKEYNFLNDMQLAQNIAKDKININKYGKNKIKETLYKKGIEQKTIHDVLEKEISPDVEFENAVALGRKKLEKIKYEDKNKIYRKLSQHLSYKGFSFDIIKKVMRALLKDDYIED